MIQDRFRKILEPLLIITIFFLSNVSAFFFVAWLAPEFVLLLTVFWLIVAGVVVLINGNYDFVFNLFRNFKETRIILPFLVFSGLSLAWSVSWETSLSRWLVFVFTIIIGAYIGSRYSLNEIVERLSVFCVVVLLLSSFFVFFMPRIGVMNYYTIQGAWKGVYWHKNHMGVIAAFANILFLINVFYSLQQKRKLPLNWISLYLFSLFFLYKTDSVGSYVVALFLNGVGLCAFLWLRFKWKIRVSHYLFFGVILILAFLILFFNADYFLGIFNRNASLTGRIPMWRHLFEVYFNVRSYLGYGFNAFWYIEAHRIAMGLLAGYPDPIVISDNGFIDILMNTGYVGTALFLIFYLGLWFRSIQNAAKAEDIIGFFPLILMIYTLLANISWSLFFENESFFMLVMISVLFSLSANIEPDQRSF